MAMKRRFLNECISFALFLINRTGVIAAEIIHDDELVGQNAYQDMHPT